MRSDSWPTAISSPSSSFGTSDNFTPSIHSVTRRRRVDRLSYTWGSGGWVQGILICLSRFDWLVSRPPLLAHLTTFGTADNLTPSTHSVTPKTRMQVAKVLVGLATDTTATHSPYGGSPSGFRQDLIVFEA